jgi:hypothetical protein
MEGVEDDEGIPGMEDVEDDGVNCEPCGPRSPSFGTPMVCADSGPVP